MKLLILLSSSLSLTAHAAPPAAETARVVAALLQSPGVAEQLRSAGTVSLLDLSIHELQSGVSRYQLQLSRNCFCPQKKAELEILEDLRPTWADGAPLYKATLKLSE